MTERNAELSSEHETRDFDGPDAVAIAAAFIGFIGWFLWLLIPDVVIALFANTIPVDAFSAFLIGILGLSLFTSDRAKRLSQILALSAIALIVATLTQHAAGAGHTIDRLFVRPDTEIPAIVRFEANPLDALALLAVAMGAIATSSSSRHRAYRILFAAAPIAILAGIGGLANPNSLEPYLPTVLESALRSIHPEAFTDRPLGAGILSGIAAMALGGAILLKWKRPRPAARWSATRSSVILTGIAGVTTSVAFWIIAESAETNTLHREIALQAQGIQQNFNTEIQSQVEGIERMADRWERANGTPWDEWTADAFNFVQDNPGFLSMEWVDRNYRIRWIEPIRGNYDALGLDLRARSSLVSYFDKAREADRATITPTIDLLTSDRGFLIITPLFVDGEFDGFMMGVVRVELLFEDIIANLGGFPFDGRISESGVSRYEFGTVDAGVYSSELPITALPPGWTIQAGPKSAVREELSSALPMAVLTLGLLVTAVMMRLSAVTLLARERQQNAEDALKELEDHRRAQQRAERLLEEALEAISEGFVLYDNEDRLVTCNRPYRRMYAISAPAMTQGARFEDIVRYGAKHGEYALDPNADDPVESFVRERMRAHGQTKGTVLQQTGDGRWIRIEERKTADGGTVGLRVDITEMVEREEHLDEARARLEEAQRIARIGDFQWSDELGRMAYASPQVGSIFGRPTHELLCGEEQFFTMLHPDDRERCSQQIGSTVGSIEPYSLEYRILRPDGTVRHVQERADATFADDGRPVGFKGTIQDVTEQKEIEFKLQRTV